MSFEGDGAASTNPTTTAATAATPEIHRAVFDHGRGSSSLEEPGRWLTLGQCPHECARRGDLVEDRAPLGISGEARFDRRALGGVALVVEVRRKKLFGKVGGRGDVGGHESADRSRRRPRWMRDRTVPTGIPWASRDLVVGEADHVAEHDRRCGTRPGAPERVPAPRRRALRSPRRRPRWAGPRGRDRRAARRRAAGASGAPRPGRRSSRSGPTIPPANPACTSRGPGGPAGAPPGRGPARRRRCRSGGRPRCRGSARDRGRPPPTWGHRQAIMRTTAARRRGSRNDGPGRRRRTG